MALVRILVACRGTPTYQLPNTAAAPSNVALLQLTGTLPFTLEVAFLGGQSNWQKTIRGPVTACGDCSSKREAQLESVSDRAKALQGKTPSQHTNHAQHRSSMLHHHLGYNVNSLFLMTALSYSAVLCGVL